MEVCVPCNTSACLDISCTSCGSSTDPHNLIQDDKGLSMNDLEICLNEVLNIEDIKISTTGFNLSSGKNDTVLSEHECTELCKNTAANSVLEKCFSKCATFPPRHEPEFPGDVFRSEKGKQKKDATAEVSGVNGPVKPANECYSRSISLPVSF